MKKIFAVILSLAILLAGYSFLSNTSLKPDIKDGIGVITLSVNPKIDIEYDNEGKVLALKAGNADGEKIIAKMNDYIGKDAKDVICNLVKEIHNEGYFVNDIDGYTKDIVIQISQGSIEPIENYFNELEEEVNETIFEIAIASNATTIHGNDYIDENKFPHNANKIISQEKAIEIALKRIDLAADQTKHIKTDIELDNGVYQYEIEILVDDIKYEVDIDASDGSALNVHKEKAEFDDFVDDEENIKTDKYIGKEKAIDIVLKDAVVERNSAKCLEADFEYANGKYIYEVEFDYNNQEFDYEIDALIGEILNKTIEFDEPEDIEDLNNDFDLEDND